MPEAEGPFFSARCLLAVFLSLYFETVFRVRRKYRDETLKNWYQEVFYAVH